MAGASEHGVLPVRRRVLDQVGAAEVGNQRAERGVRLDAGQRSAVAEVDTAAEAEALLKLIDLAVRGGGMQVAEAAVALTNKIRAAAKETT